MKDKATPHLTDSPKFDPPAPLVGGIIPYLELEGAMAAAEFYVRAFHAKEMGRVPPDKQGRTMHVHLLINNGSIMMSDFFPEHGFAPQKPQAFILHLPVDDIEKWWKRAVAAGCTVRMELADAFWGDRYGQLVDPWGVTWAMAQPIKAN